MPAQVAPETPAVASPQGAPVAVRRVPWERVQRALNARHEAEVASDVPVESWTADQHARLRDALLRELQAPPGAQVLGQARVQTTLYAAPPADQLQAQARRVGADTVVWTGRLLGKADRVDREFVFIDSYSHDPYYDAHRTRAGSAFPQRSVASVPVVRSADEHELWAFFLRTSPASP